MNLAKESNVYIFLFDKNKIVAYILLFDKNGNCGMTVERGFPMYIMMHERGW
jgi:hypothetical protein